MIIIIIVINLLFALFFEIYGNLHIDWMKVVLDIGVGVIKSIWLGIFADACEPYCDHVQLFSKYL